MDNNMMEVSSLDKDYPSGSLSVRKSEDTGKLTKKPTIEKLDTGKRLSMGFDALLHEVLIPSLLKVGANALHQVVDLLIFQDPSRIGNGRKSSSDGIYVSYSSSYDGSERRRYHSDSILVDHFASKDEAWDVLRWMKKKIRNNGSVSLGHLYDYIGESRAGNSTDFTIVWNDLDDASVYGGGRDWTLELPNPD